MSRLQKLLGVGKGYLERLPPVDVHKLLRLILLNLPYIMIFYVGNKLAWLYQYCAGNSMIERLIVLVLNFQLAFSRILPSMHKNELLVGLTGAVGVKLMVYLKGKNAKKFRQGVEYGSARWGTAKDIAPFIDPIFENNILLTMTERLTMNGRPKNPKFARNKNVIVIGGSGSGKTRFYVKPNLMQMGKYISYVVTDPKGTIIIECGMMLVRNGYKIKVLNTINFSKSMHYNPFHYIRSEKDILKLVNTIMVNTKGEGEKSSEDFWSKAERLLYCALIGYIWYEAPEEEQNFSMLIDLVDASEAREDDENFKNAVDLLFEELEQGNINPASIISMFEEEEDQREAASLFHTKLERLESTAEQEKALHDIVCAVKRNSYERDSAQLGTDVAALNRVIAGKKQLEELAKTHISLE